MKITTVLFLFILMGCNTVQKNSRTVSSDQTQTPSVSCEGELNQIKGLEGSIKVLSASKSFEFDRFITAYVIKIGNLNSVSLSNGESVDCTHILDSLDKKLIQKVQQYLDPLGAALQKFNMYGESQ